VISFNGNKTDLKLVKFNNNYVCKVKLNGVVIFASYKWVGDSVVSKTINSKNVEIGVKSNLSTLIFKNSDASGNEITNSIVVDSLCNFNGVVDLYDNKIIFSGNSITVSDGINTPTSVTVTDGNFKGQSVISGKYPQITTNNNNIIFKVTNDNYTEIQLTKIV